MKLQKMIDNNLEAPKNMSNLEIDFRQGMSCDDLQKKYGCRFLFLDAFLSSEKRKYKPRPDVDMILEELNECKKITNQELNILKKLPVLSIANILYNYKIKNIEWLNINFNFWLDVNVYKEKILEMYKNGKTPEYISDMLFVRLNSVEKVIITYNEHCKNKPIIPMKKAN